MSTGTGRNSPSLASTTKVGTSSLQTNAANHPLHGKRKVFPQQIGAAGNRVIIIICYRSILGVCEQPACSGFKPGSVGTGNLALLLCPPSPQALQLPTTPLPQPRGSCHPLPCFVPRPCHPHHTWVPPPVASRPLPHDAAMLGPTCGLLRWGRREGASPHRPTPSLGRGGRSAISCYFKWVRLAQGLMGLRGTRHGWEDGMGEGGRPLLHSRGLLAWGWCP